MKRYIIIIFFSFFLSLSSNAQNINAKFMSANLVYNNSVGNEWSTSVKVNGDYVRDREIHEYSGNTLTIECAATERDKYSDYGDNKRIINIGDIPTGEPKIVTVEVIVKEDRGRYAGNTAKWEFKFQVSK